MFKRKRIKVHIGDIFAEQIRAEGRILKALGLNKNAAKGQFSSHWAVTAIRTIDGLAHAEMRIPNNSAKRLIAIDSLELQENYERVEHKAANAKNAA